MKHTGFQNRQSWNPRRLFARARLSHARRIFPEIKNATDELRSLMSMVLGQPESTSSFAHCGETGVDESFGACFKFAKNKTATVTATITTKTDRDAIIMGSLGYIKIHSPLTFPPAISVCLAGQDEQIIDTKYEGWGFVFEAKEAMRCIREELTESPLLPLSETYSIMQIMDELRSQWGLEYPGE